MLPLHCSCDWKMLYEVSLSGGSKTNHRNYYRLGNPLNTGVIVMVCYGILDKGYGDIWKECWILACFNRKSWLSLLHGLLRFWWCVSNEPWRWNIDVGMFQRLGILGKPTGTRTPFWIPRSSFYTIWAKRCLFLKDWLFWMSCSHGFALIFLMASSCSFESLW